MGVWRIHSLHTITQIRTHLHTFAHIFTYFIVHFQIHLRTLLRTLSCVSRTHSFAHHLTHTPLPALAKVPRDWEAHRWLWPNWFFCCRKTLGRTSQSVDITWQYRYRTRAVNQKRLLPGKLVALLAVLTIISEEARRDRWTWGLEVRK